jgi:hypothetical protein
MADDIELPNQVDVTADDLLYTDTYTVDPSVKPSLDTGYIKANVSFLPPDSTREWFEVDDDIISITTDQGTSKQEGDATAKMTVTLNNNNQKYANKFVPQATLVASYIEIERNVVNGNNIDVVFEAYPLFFGRVQEISMNHETCTVDCGDETSVMEGSVEFDFTWPPDVPLEKRINDIMDGMDPRPLLNVENGLSEKIKQVVIEGNTSSAESGQSNISNVVRSSALDWTVPSDQPTRLILIDSKFRAGTYDPDMTEFLQDPQDNESIVGYCNTVPIMAGTDKDPTGTEKAVTTSDSEKTYIPPDNTANQEGIDKFGVVESKRYSLQWMNAEQAKQFQTNITDIYKSYEDRLITPVIVDKIPILSSYLHYLIRGASYPDDYKSANGITEEEFVRQIDVKVLRKRVSYDGSSGVISQLECKRRGNESEEGGVIPDNIEKDAQQLPGDRWILFTFNVDTGEIKAADKKTTAEKEAFMAGTHWPDFPFSHYTSVWKAPNPRWSEKYGDAEAGYFKKWKASS